MGKARIVESVGAGEYRVVPIYEGRRMILNKIHAAGNCAEIDVEIEFLSSDLEKLISVVKEKEEELTQAILEKVDIDKASSAFSDAQKEARILAGKINMKKIFKLSALKRTEIPGQTDAITFKYCAFEFKDDLEEKIDQYIDAIPDLESKVNTSAFEVSYAEQVVDARVAEVAACEEDVAFSKAALDAAIEQAEIDNADLKAALDAAITEGDEDEIAEAQEAYDIAMAEDTATERAAYGAAVNSLKTAEAELAAAQKALSEATATLLNARIELSRTIAYRGKIAEIISISEEAPPVVAWCADYNEELTGDVGTIEPGLAGGNEHIIIHPGGTDGSKSSYQPERDGILQPLQSATPASAFYDYAMLPGVVKWFPRFRLGEITNIDESTGLADIALDPLRLTHQNIDVNQTDVLTAVPIVYMECNCSVFEVGDRVVVAFGE